jgi:hypothetical protein
MFRKEPAGGEEIVAAGGGAPFEFRCLAHRSGSGEV